MIAILGAGSLGRLWAATLPAGQVAFVPRPQTSAESPCYRFHPVNGEPVPTSVPWLTPCQSPDLLLVTTKAGDTLSALQATLPSIPESTPIVLFQNGMGSQQAVSEHWPERSVLAASTTEGANRPSPDRLIHAGRGQTWVGALSGNAECHLETVVERLARSGLAIAPEADILARLWHKLVINAGINPFTAILDCANGDLLSQAFYQRWIAPLCREISNISQISGQPAEAPEAIRHRIEAVARSTSANTSSMRADVIAGRPTEIDYMNGYLSELGQRLGVKTPVNQMLTEQVKQLTRPYQQQESCDGQPPLQDLHPNRR
ncbi:2-dehydropantoate 2-reductase [Marinobacter daepoensis]|uniref:2-dehydropantoate 2-reductase n=1 Tax=Marinobacter daepoensis TaxID=262077 RepID=A0ABS3BIQ9_9GAMM|nr:2-dehydropantoate 2-reductase [Marinobacter daepoensis]MBN7771720.1 2-dehydropantoate 2-reductase [Marinobacter daepoensis]MBY6080898.1 2-dehydropantoate 2-reductase [Marinobacter daepoensis]